MRWLIISIMTFTCISCTQVTPINTSVIDQLEERLEFDLTKDNESMQRALSFIRDVKRREPKVHFLVEYKTGASEFVANLHGTFKSEGIAKDSYKVSLAQDKQTKNVVITAQYVRIKSSECGVMTFANRDSYRFGCSVEHNRNLSLVNPIKRVR